MNPLNMNQELRAFNFHEHDIMVQNVPFEHFVIEKAIPTDLHQNILNAFKNDHKWIYKESDFSQVYQLPLKNNRDFSAYRYLNSQDTFDYLINSFSHKFKINLAAKVDIFAIKLVPGFSMRIHTDNGPDKQVFRFQVYINAEENWNGYEQGGLLMMFDSPTPSAPSDKHRYYQPIARSGIGFKITNKSYHAISPIKCGERYTVIYSFYDN